MIFPRFAILSLITAVCLIISCSKKEEEMMPEPIKNDSSILVLTFSAYGNGNTLGYKKEFNDVMNRKMYVELLKHYVSNISLLNGGTAVNLTNDIGLITYIDGMEADPDGLERKMVLKARIGHYSGLKLGLGLDPVTNSLNPLNFPNAHPLSSDQNTYWGAWTKYKFFMIEGKADVDGDKILTDIFGYHTGYDDCYREKSFNTNIEIKANSTAELNFAIEVNEIFFGADSVDFAAEPFWHGEKSSLDRALRLSDNLMNSLRLE